MIFFRDEEKKMLIEFERNKKQKAMAIYGRRRTGKTALVIDFYNSQKNDKCVYFQCSSYDYALCLTDFIKQVKFLDPDSEIMEHFITFKDLFVYLAKIGIKNMIFIIDEFPFIAKKNKNVSVEFQWIIDHGLADNKLILLGSSLSFMKRQISDREAPLYGRFDKIIEIRPFTFTEVNRLFKKFDDAVEVYARTGGVAQYVMLYHEYSSVKKADEALLFHPDGQLFNEAENLLMQELRDVSTYVSILRTIGAGEKDSGQIASKCGMDQRAVFAYINKLIDLSVIASVDNPLSAKQKAKRYEISDMLFRFHYSFIEPNVSMITAIRQKSIPFILDDHYKEYLGFIYENIIRNQCYEYALIGKLQFMPNVIGKWWGNIQEEGVWKESEIDVVAYDNRSIVLGECKYRNKAVGKGELDILKLKAQFVPIKGRKVYYLLASRSGFTDELKNGTDDSVLLIEKI